MENHILNIEGREKMTVTEVTDVKSFNEEAVLISLKKGGLMVKGQRLHIQKLDLAEGKVVIDGFVYSMVYTDKKDKDDKSLLKKIFQ